MTGIQTQALKVVSLVFYQWAIPLGTLIFIDNNGNLSSPFYQGQQSRVVTFQIELIQQV